MTWMWRYEGPDGTAAGATGVGQEQLPERQDFPTQADAETWVGENWRDLRESGVHAVSLYEGDRKEYGPMGLDPA